MPSSLFGNRAVASQQLYSTANPIPQGMIQPPANLEQIKGFMKMMQSAGDPNALFTSFVKSNPTVGPIMQSIAQHGGDGKAAFYEQAKQMGIDPQQALAQIKSWLS